MRPELTPPYPLDRLAGLLGADRSGARAEPTVTGVAFDNRQVRPGDLYVGLPGANTHGARFAREAVQAGAVAVLTDAAGAGLIAHPDELDTPVLRVADPRRAMSTAAAEVYGRPATKLIMIGVTGTNGKTTTSDLTAAGLRATGLHCGVIGTLGYFLDGGELPGNRTTITTPESPDVQALLAIMVEHGADVVVMEVSSHALALGRVDEIVFDVAGFTNLGRDHLDFHGSEEAYFEAKAQLFTPQHARRAVINIDDARGPELLSRSTAGGLQVATTSLAGSPGAGVDHYRCLSYDAVADPVEVSIQTPAGELDFRLGLPGSYNVANAITALAMLDRLGIDLPTAAGGLAAAAVPGRLQRVELSDGPRAYVDFAHTPQAIRSVLTELAATVADGRLITVLGCGGDRDPAKRGPMGAAAAELSDLVIITDDNPRSEDPRLIRAAALAGAREQADRQSRPVDILDGGDRAGAIRTALAAAGRSDVVAVLGKGHEHGQEINGTVVAFDDAEQLASGWHELAAGTPAESTGKAGRA
ncbi:UDP-N-acetylmuramoyl-L-alanyl-D-glutamate--2,6-diaminopimelate ligase [Microlunatus sp. Gsoil 973]|uniref:UDP-N-acetylmuramoyl-L-alanyl-D-glutamate--2, 6-diaminopimelate ligase n=1 Tax=Microlunatus sp. Gsoil 973 TaxID=2672569 RepID=UPI00351AF364